MGLQAGGGLAGGHTLCTSRASCTAFLNPVFGLVFAQLSTRRSMSQLFCSVDEIEALASSEYYETPAAFRVAISALSAVLKSFPSNWLPTLPA